MNSNQEPASPKLHHRRKRYTGTHPRRFDERYKERDPAKYPEMQEHVRAQGRTPAGTHVPIMVDEVLAALKPAPGEIVADVTLGYGGHAEALTHRTAPDGILIGLDLDGPQLVATRERLEKLVNPSRLSLHNSHFAGLPKILAASQFSAVDIIFADLGLSSMQIDNPQRGFSYKHDGPLDMRMDPRRPTTAATLLRDLPLAELSAAFRELADEPDHDAIARAVVDGRRARPIITTGDLSDLVLGAKGITRRQWRESKRKRGGHAASVGEPKLHPAARAFQALRIMVNDELNGLAQFLRVAPLCLKPGGRVAVLTFHSGEERRVVDAFDAGLTTGTYERVSENAQRAGPEERRANPRSTAARLRWAVRAR